MAPSERPEKGTDQARSAGGRQAVDVRKGHPGFGQGGPHLCLGMWLARLEVRVLFQELAKRIKSIEPAGEQKFLRSNFVAGLKSLPVRVTLQ